MPKFWQETKAKLFRANLLYELGLAKEQSAVDYARAEFDKIKSGNSTINSEMKSKVFYVIGRLGEDFESLKKLHTASNMPAEKNILERAIGHARCAKSVDQVRG